MTAPEFDNGFDILYNNITSNAAPALDAYEKSFFLTKAQNELVKNHFSNEKQGYGSNPKRERDFAYLNKTVEYKQVLSGDDITKSHSESILVKTDNLSKRDVLMIINESVKIGETLNYRYLPVSILGHNELDRLMSKPFKYPSHGQAWRINTHIEKISSDNDTTEYVELVIPYGETFYSYILKYIRMPKPIILYNDSSESPETIEGKSEVSDYTDWGNDGDYKNQACELAPELHDEILQRAVELAKIAYIGNSEAIIQTGTRSE